MLKFIFAPQWFYSADLIFDLFSIFVSFLISLFIYKIYKFTNEVKYKYFALSFFAISFSLIFKILSHAVVYYEPIKKELIGSVIAIFKTINLSLLFYFLGFFAYVFLMLAGFFGIFLVLTNLKSKKNMLLILYLLAINAAVVSFVPYFLGSQKNPFYYTFHLTASVILFFISHSYYKHYKKRENIQRLLLFISFTLLFFSQLAFMFIFTDYPLYIIGQILQLAAFCILLYDYLLIIKVGKSRK